MYTATSTELSDLTTIDVLQRPELDCLSASVHDGIGVVLRTPYVARLERRKEGIGPKGKCNPLTTPGAFCVCSRTNVRTAHGKHACETLQVNTQSSSMRHLHFVALRQARALMIRSLVSDRLFPRKSTCSRWEVRQRDA